MNRTAGHAALLGAALLVTAPVQAADWKHEFAPYVWGSGMSGETAIGPVTADIDLSFGDILEDLELGFMGAYRAKKDRLSITVDGIYMGLGGNGRGSGGYVYADADVDQTALEVDVGYDVGERLTVFGGLRYTDLSINIDTSGPLGTRSADGDQDWVDPVIGAHYLIPFADTWSLNLRGDIGGFGVGSQFAWQMVGTLRWQFSERTGMLAAYRYIDMDYEDGSGNRTFKYDMALSGPALGFVFTF
jgi:hypothetical protein